MKGKNEKFLFNVYAGMDVFSIESLEKYIQEAKQAGFHSIEFKKEDDILNEHVFSAWACECCSEYPDDYDYREITLDILVKIWNEIAGQYNFKKIRAIGEKNDIKKSALEAFKLYPHIEHWQRIICSVPNPHRMGVNDRGWKASLQWLFQNKMGTKTKNYNLIYSQWLEENGESEI